MSKSFEEAYIADVQQNIPDLWNRIESGLPEKKAVQKVVVKKKNPYVWIKWASLAAAALLLIVLIPATIGIGFIGIGFVKNASGDSMAMESQEAAMDQMATGNVKYEIEDENMAAAEEEMYAEDILTDGGTESGAVSEGGFESVEEETAASELLQNSEPYRELVMEDVYAQVTEVTVTEDGYGVKLEIASLSRIAMDLVFENDPFYEDGILTAIVYDGSGEVPVVGEKYRIDIFDRTPEFASLILPYEVVLELNES